MKKLMLCGLVWILACVCMTNCLAQEATVPEDTQTRILSDWFDYLQQEEAVYSDMLWALSYVQTYCESGSWTDLQIARAVLCTAKGYIEQRDLPERAVTTEEYIALTAENAEVGGVLLELESFSACKDGALHQCNTLGTDLMQNYYTVHMISSLEQMVKTNTEYYDYCLQYDAAMTDYLMLILQPEAELAARFNEYISDYCPRIAAYRSSDPDVTAAQLEAQINGCLDQIEELLLDQAAIEGAKRADLYQLEDVINGTQNSNEVMITFDSAPLFLPFPDWFVWENAQIVYYWLAQDGSHVYMKERENVSSAPDGWIAVYPDIDTQAVEQYIDWLETLGLSPTDLQETDGEIMAMYSLADTQVSFIGSDGKAYFSIAGSDVDFAPWLYIDYLYD